MFGNKGYITEEQVAELIKPLTERLDRLSELVDRQTAVVQQLAERLDALSDRVDSTLAESPSDPAPVMVPAMDEADCAPKEPEETATRFFSMPSPDGAFTESTAREVVGKSIYRMRTEDGTNGHFVMLSTPDAIATAMISVSQFVKPVCRIEGNTHRQPQRIVTLEEGVVRLQGETWKVVKKATVQFL